jgi:hypothetical protein
MFKLGYYHCLGSVRYFVKPLGSLLGFVRRYIVFILISSSWKIRTSRFEEIICRRYFLVVRHVMCENLLALFWLYISLPTADDQKKKKKKEKKEMEPKWFTRTFSCLGVTSGHNKDGINFFAIDLGRENHFRPETSPLIVACCRFIIFIPFIRFIQLPLPLFL